MLLLACIYPLKYCPKTSGSWVRVCGRDELWGIQRIDFNDREVRTQLPVKIMQVRLQAIAFTLNADDEIDLCPIGVAERAAEDLE